MSARYQGMFGALTEACDIDIVEADTVPKTYVNNGRQRLPLPSGGTQPIGNRIIELPEDAARCSRPTGC